MVVMTSHDPTPGALPAALTATIDLDAIAHNVGVLRAASGTDLIAVVKATGAAPCP